MATTVTDTIAEAIIAVALPASSTRYISLHSADPAKTGANEIAGTGYARQAVLEASDFSAAAADGGTGGRHRQNANIIDFGTAGSAWGTVSHVGFWTAVTSGTFIGGAPLSVSQSVASGNSVSFPVTNFALVGAGI